MDACKRAVEITVEITQNSDELNKAQYAGVFSDRSSAGSVSSSEQWGYRSRVRRASLWSVGAQHPNSHSQFSQFDST